MEQYVSTAIFVGDFTRWFSLTCPEPIISSLFDQAVGIGCTVTVNISKSAMTLLVLLNAVSF